MNSPTEIRASHVFDVSQPLGEPAQLPEMVPQDTLPMLDKNDEEKHHKEADSQGWPENLHSTCFRGPL